ncbi:DUF1499 domain-containing protein [Maricaulis sp.]|uniref:DUF1499 domain-containing protein n=1 Tax=Maricaulis sp. TaxID=1486257 RepID=UPI0026033BFD|nr:DUF1499 domain-containing protein [Maricaulis sp.]
MTRFGALLHTCVSMLTWLSGMLILVVPGWFLVAVLGTKWEFWDWRFGYLTLTQEAGFYVLLAGMVTAALAVIAIVLHRFVVKQDFGEWSAPIIALVLSLAGFGWMWFVLDGQSAQPAVLEVSTDLERPPNFTTAFYARRGTDRATMESEVRTGPDGRSFATLQAELYPGITSLYLDAPVDIAFQRALLSARELGLHVSTASERSGMFEAATEGFWYGFRDDVVVRIEAIAPDEAGEGGGSRVDIRSIAREDVHDGGRNARRVEDFLVMMQGEPEAAPAQAG